MQTSTSRSLLQGNSNKSDRAQRFLWLIYTEAENRRKSLFTREIFAGEVCNFSITNSSVYIIVKK